MASTCFKVNKASKSGGGVRNKSLYKQWMENYDEDPYDDDDFVDPSLSDAQMQFFCKRDSPGKFYYSKKIFMYI